MTAGTPWARPRFQSSVFFRYCSGIQNGLERHESSFSPRPRAFPFPF